MKSVATDKLTTANLHKCVNQDKMTKTEHTLVLKMLKYSWKRSFDGSRPGCWIKNVWS